MNALLLLAVLAGNDGVFYDDANGSCLALSGGTITGDIDIPGDFQVCDSATQLELGGCSGCSAIYATAAGDTMICGAVEVTGASYPKGGSYYTAAIAGSTCDGDKVCIDNDGVRGSQLAAGTTDPDHLMIRAGGCNPGDGTCTAANVNIFGGQDTSVVVIDAADPSVTCPTDTVTVTVINNAGSSTATVLTEGTNWTAVASQATTCTNLAAAVDAVTGVSASCSTATVQIYLDAGTGAVTLAESDGNCTGATTGTPGRVIVGSPIASSTVRFGAGDGNTFVMPRVDIRGTAASDVYATFGSAGTAYLAVNETEPRIRISSANLLATAAAITRTDVIQFCGNGPNGATAVYLEPLVEAALYADATCDGNDSTTETTSDMVWRPFDYSAVSMECGCVDVAVDTGLTFSFRDDTADASSDLTCTTGAGDASGFVSCEDQDTTPPTVAAGSAIAMKIVAASGNFSTADCWCRLTVSQ